MGLNKRILRQSGNLWLCCIIIIIYSDLSIVTSRLYGQAVNTVSDFYSEGQSLHAPDIFSDNHKCGFPIILNSSNPSNTEMFYKLESYYVKRDSLDLSIMSPSGHFKIHYTLNGIHAIPTYDRNKNLIPDYLEFVSNSFDRAWEIEVDSLGFKPPPDIDGNPRSVYPVECRLSSVYGSTIWNPETDEIHNLPGINYVTTVEINTNFSFVYYPTAKDDIERDSMAIAVTAAHEFNHALQAGYRLWADNSGYFEDIWFIESSAVYMEEVVASEVNDYLNYLPAYFNRTSFPLDESSGDLSDYGKVVFEIVLGKFYGHDITRKVWAGIVEQRARPALEKVLQSEGSSLSRQMVNLATWLYYSGEDRFIPGQFFPDAALFPEIDFIPANPISPNAQTVLEDSLPKLAFQWYESPYQSSQSTNALLQVLQGSSASDLSAVYIDVLSKSYYQIPASTSFDLPFQLIPDILPFAAVSTGIEDQLQKYRLLTRSQQTETESEFVVFPQPFVLSEHQAYLTFKNIPPSAQIFIFSSTGKLLQTLRNDSHIPYIYWDLSTSQGKTIGSGVYLYRLKTDNGEKNGKFMVIK
jgi:hypothetical protein